MPFMGDTQVGLEKGTVASGSGLHVWGFKDIYSNAKMRETMNYGKRKYTKMLETLNSLLKGEEQQLTGKPLRIRVADTPLAMIAMRLPLPRVAQKYPVENLILDK